MFISSSSQTSTAYYTSAESATTATGVDRGSARGAIPPVEAAEKEAAAQNQQFNTRSPANAPVEGDVENNSRVTQSSATDKTAAEEQSKTKADTEKQVQQQQLQEDQVVIDQLKARDREVRVHEAAHAAVGGQFAGSPSYEFTRGPDGKNYATGGEVSISVSEANDPQATIEKARVIQAAALAPAQPSSQDRQVAAEAARMELNAQAELQQVKADEAEQTKQAREDEVDKTTESDDSPSTEQSEKPSDDISSDYASDSTQLRPSADTASVAKGEGLSAKPDSASQSEDVVNSGPAKTYIQQFLEQGPTDPQNPYGKSGQLNILA